MANDYFSFKQFTILQDRCAMKVTTVACIQGAWLPDFSPNRILDIGAGTGLLSLMTAQVYGGIIDAVEIEDDAFYQLQENIARSPWADKISCHHMDINKFAVPAGDEYDFIICNPPFFGGQLQSADPKTNQARHQISLTIKDLIGIAARALTRYGKISILLPPLETAKLAAICEEKSLFQSARLAISNTEKKEPKAIVTILTKEPSKFKTAKLIVKNSNGVYSSDFQSLLKAYYLNL